MDLRQISYFVALFEERSVTRAAKRMHVVQPALSMQIAKLEQELGLRLFDRLPKEMAPTAEGGTLYRLVQPILRDVADARTTMARLSKTVSGRVTVGILSSLSMSVVPNVLSRFTSAYPDVELSLADGYSSIFIEGVSSGALDLAVINRPPKKISLVMEPLLEEEMVVVGGRDTVLPIEIPVQTRDLPQLDLVLPSKRHGLRVEIDRRLAAEDIALAPRIEHDLPPAIADYIAQSNAFTVLPSLAVRQHLAAGILKAYRIVKPRIIRHLVVVHHPQRPMSAAALKLVEILKEEIDVAATALRDVVVGDT